MGRIRNNIRNNRGGTGIAELGPALFVLIIVIMIPLCDLLALCCSYAAGYLLNNTMARECAVKNPTASASMVVPPQPPQTPIGNVTQAVQIADSAWKNNILISGLAQAKGATTIHTVTYVNNSGVAYPPVTFTVPPSGTPSVSGGLSIPAPTPATAGNPGIFVATCQVVTQLPIKPLFVVPFMDGVPGLSAPLTLTYSCQRPQEEKGYQ
jgi:hypothetical protein